MRIGKRTAQLLREAIVLAHVEGSRWGQSHGRGDEYPSDSEIVRRVLEASVSFADLYPTLAKTDDAQLAHAERVRRSSEFLAAMLNRRDGEPR